jgi:hypothetical protein
MNKKLLFFLALLVAVFYISSCEYNNEEELYTDMQNNVCDTIDMSFSADIYVILDKNCIGCHNAISPNGSVRLDNYDEVKKVADNGRLYGVINHDAGFKPMPLNQPKLSDCEILKVKAWIDAGALNN